MLNEKISTSRIEGWLTIWGIDKDGKKHLLVDQHNALVTNAKTILANVLGGTSSFALDTIAAMRAGFPLALRGTTVSYPASDKVKFVTLFDEASFNDTVDEVRLVSNAGGDFSNVTGLSIFKDNTLQLSIEWLLTIV